MSVDYLDLKLSLYSQKLLGSIKDAQTVPRKVSCLERLGLFDNRTRSLTLTDWKDVLTLFRVVNFTSADLQITRDFSSAEILAYCNPCNLRTALDRSIDACNQAGLVDVTKELFEQTNIHFSGSKETESTSLSSTTPPGIDSLKNILEDFEICSGSGGYTLRSLRDMKRGETVISLDQANTISIFSAFRDPNFPGESLYRQGLHPDTIFLLFLLYLRDNKDSITSTVFREFISCQPESYNTMFEWPSEQLESIDEPDLISSVQSQNDFLRSVCDSLHPSPTFKDMLWAKSLCTSRAFSLPLKPESVVEKEIISEYYTSGLITTILPGVHFINHDFRAQLATPEVSGDSVIVRCFSDIKKNSQVFLIYGGFTNKELLLNYGFFVPGNPYDSVETSSGKLIRRGALEKRVDEMNDGKSVVEGYLADRELFHKQVKYFS